MKRRLYLRYLAVIGLIAFWFLGVDSTFSVEDCPHCHLDKDVMRYRILTIPIHERVQVDESLIHLVSVDLGVECRHPQLTSSTKYRWWGLYFCARPCFRGLYGIVVPPDYTQACQVRLKAMVAANPSLPAEFQQRVLKEHDREYWHAMVAKLRADEVDDAKTDP